MNTATDASPSSCLLALENILNPLALEQVFPQSQPVQVELGSGDGSFLANYAAKHPEWNFIGVERLLGRLRKLDRKAQRAGLSNVRAVRLEAAYFLQYLVPKKSLAALHVYFPDPWPKRKHRRHRLINADFPAMARSALRNGGELFLRTDHAEYFAQMTSVFASHPEFQSFSPATELMETVTDFERNFHLRGVQTLSAAWRLTEV